MTKKEFLEKLEFGLTTAFVFDEPNNRYNYASGEIEEDMFPNDAEYHVEPIDSLPIVRDIIISNFLTEFDLGHLKEDIKNGNAEIGWWEDDDFHINYVLLPIY